MKSEEIQIKERTLEVFEAAIQSLLPYSERHMYSVEVVPTHAVDAMLVRLRRYIYREQAGEEERTVQFVYLEPASWWQMLKRDHLPRWMVRRWPVRHRALTVPRKIPLKVYAEYPGYVAPIGSQFEKVTIREYPDLPVLDRRNDHIRRNA